jgi:hypothetical protein
MNAEKLPLHLIKFFGTQLRRMRAFVSLLLVGMVLIDGPGHSPTATAQQQGTKNYSPYVDLAYPAHVYWGETHLHTSYSPNAGLVDDRPGRLPMGEAIQQ